MIAQLTELESEERHKEANEQAMREARERIVELGFEWDKAVVERAKLVLRHQEALSLIGKAQTDLIEAKLRLIEAKSDIEGLKARNSDIMEKLEQEKLVVQQATDEATQARELGRGLSDKVRELISENPDKKDTYTSLAENKMAAEIEMDISAEQANLELIHAANPNVIREFEKREQEIAKLTKKMDASNGKLATITQQLDELMSKWEPKLDALVSKVNNAFAYNFEQISCAGEVRVNKTEDFDQWALDIMVKFRYVFPPFSFYRLYHIIHTVCKLTTNAQRKRIPPTTQRPPPIWRRARRLHHLLPHGPPIHGPVPLPRRRRDQPGHGPPQRAHGPRAHG